MEGGREGRRRLSEIQRPRDFERNWKRNREMGGEGERERQREREKERGRVSVRGTWERERERERVEEMREGKTKER